MARLADTDLKNKSSEECLLSQSTSWAYKRKKYGHQSACEK